MSSAAATARISLSAQTTRETGAVRSTQASQGEAQPPLDEYFNSLLTAFGPQHWWPGKTRFEIIVGAILTQNTSWTNVERAIVESAGAPGFSPLPQSRKCLCGDWNA